jgi:hypothetical protein
LLQGSRICRVKRADHLKPDRLRHLTLVIGIAGADSPLLSASQDCLNVINNSIDEDGAWHILHGVLLRHAGLLT